MALNFPRNLSDKYYFDLKFVKYRRPNPYSGKINLSAAAGSFGGAEGTGGVRLPIPAHMVDSQTLKWVQEENIDGMTGVAGNLAGSIGSMTTGDLLGAGSKMGDALAGFGTNIAHTAAGWSQVMQQALSRTTGVNMGDPAALFLQSAGLALNPVLTQTFKHPEFKQHQFSWRLAPRTIDESAVLQQIVELIKFNSLPDIVGGGMFYSYPSLALIDIHTGNNGSLYNFQPAVVQNVTVNWAPTGVPAFFAGTNAPTEVQIDVALIEIILNHRSNYLGVNDMSNFNVSLGNLPASDRSRPLSDFMDALY